MAAPVRTDKVFGRLGRRAPPGLLRKFSGSIRFDIDADGSTERWRVTIENNDVTATRDNREADCVIRISREVFDRIVRKEDILFAAILRNDVMVEGKMRMLTPFRWLLGES